MKLMQDNLAELFRSICLKHNNRTAILNKQGYRTESITYAELYDRVQRAAALLHELDIKKKDRILLIGSNSLEWVTVFFAAVSQGIIAVPLDYTSSNDFAKKVAVQTKAKAAFSSRKLRLGIPVINFSELESKTSKPHPKQEATLTPSDVAEILYTSGTTGTPKGVVLTHENFTASVSSLRKAVKIPPIKFISVLPLSHILEQVAGLIGPMSYGCTILYPQTLRPGKLAMLMRNKSVNAMVAVPAILESLKKQAASGDFGKQFFLIGAGGAKLDAELEKYWMGKLKFVLQGYGLTETTALATTNTLFRKKICSAGRPLPGVEIKTSNGEILVKGKNVFHSYYKDREKTRKAFSNGWFRTGDIGSLKGKYLYIESRKEDMMVTSAGENIYPYDIEKVLNKTEGIQESCAIEENGKIKAILLLSRKANPEQIIRNANRKLMPKQRISNYAVWQKAAFPKTPLGKIRRHLVRKAISTKAASHGQENMLLAILSEVSGKKPKQDSTLGYDLSMDSLQRVQLLTKIEENFSIEIQEDRITETTTVRHLREMIEQQEKTQKLKLEKWLLSPGTKAIRETLHQFFFAAVINVFCKLRCEGRENLSQEKPAIFFSNHQSSLDVACIMKCMPGSIRRKMAVAASPSRIYAIPQPEKNRMLRKIESLLIRIFSNTYPFGTEIGVEGGLEFTGEMLDRGYSILVFPEGRRTTTGKMQQFRTGAGFLALAMDAKIMPVKVEGLFDILPTGKFWPKKGKAAVKFGRPIELKGMSYIEAAKQLQQEVRKL